MDVHRESKKVKVKSSHTGNKKFSVSWLAVTIVLTFSLCALISFFTASRLQDVALEIAFILLFVIIFIGIIFDILGTAVTAASETPFHAMASNRVPGARYAIKLIRHAEKVANVCNDVVGDVCGIISGAVGTLIVTDLVALHQYNFMLTSLLTTSAISAMMVGGKAMGKTFALANCNSIIFFVSRIIYIFGRKK